MIEHVELVIVIGFFDPLDQVGETGDRPAVDLQQVVDRNGIVSRIEVTDVAENVASGVADPAVRFGDLLQDMITHPGVIAVILGGDPEAQQFGAEFIDDFFRGDDIAD